MNNKAKLLLGLTSILAVSGAVAATSTFAWFTTTRTAQVNVTSMTVYNTASKLKIAYSAVTDGGADSGSVSGTNNLKVVGTTNAKITDLSGDGHTLYRPDWVPGGEGTTASSIAAKTNSSGNYYYLRFGMTFTNEGNVATDVYLNSGSSVFGHIADGESEATAASKLAAQATRVAFMDGDTVLTNWQYDTTDGTTLASYSYLATGGTTPAYGVSGYQLATPTAKKFVMGDFHAVSSNFNTSGDYDNQKLCSLAASGASGDAKTITVTIWIEGSLVAAKNAAIGGLVDAKIYIAAI